jgi:hypothetical protein
MLAAYEGYAVGQYNAAWMVAHGKGLVLGKLQQGRLSQQLHGWPMSLFFRSESTSRRGSKTKNKNNVKTSSKKNGHPHPVYGRYDEHGTVPTFLEVERKQRDKRDRREKNRGSSGSGGSGSSGSEESRVFPSHEEENVFALDALSWLRSQGDVHGLYLEGLSLAVSCTVPYCTVLNFILLDWTGLDCFLVNFLH